MIRMILGLVAVLSLVPIAVQAQEEQLPDTFAFRAGVLYVLDSDTDFSVRSNVGALGTSINFERDLSGDDTTTSPRFQGYYRFTPHHRIDFGYFRTKREGSRIITREIKFGNITFPISAGVESSIETETTKLAYTWSFYHEEKIELGLSAGVHLTGYEFMLRNLRRTLVEDTSVRELLPVVGVRADYMINPRWHVLFDYETFYIELQDDIRGSLDDVQMALEYRPLRNVSFGASANRLAVDVKVEEPDFRGSITDLYRGGMLYVGFHF